MSKDKKHVILNWEQFKALGNPDNVNEIKDDDQSIKAPNLESQRIRIYLERKKRRGKSVSIIKGLKGNLQWLEEVAKKIKTKCGVGGSIKNQEIIIQGDKRTEIMAVLLQMGYKDVKNAGA